MSVIEGEISPEQALREAVCGTGYEITRIHRVSDGMVLDWTYYTEGKGLGLAVAHATGMGSLSLGEVKPLVVEPEA